MTNEPSAPPRASSGGPLYRRLAFPKSRRLLKAAEFKQVYEQGFKVPCACFLAFCWQSPSQDGPKVGFTTPRALGKAAQRNRMKRRVRETFRRELWRITPGWRLVLNLRRAALDAPREQLGRDVERVLAKCSG